MLTKVIQGLQANSTFMNRKKYQANVTSSDQSADKPRGAEDVTGKKAVAVKQTIDEWMANFVNTDLPVAYEKQPGQGMTWKENFTGWWNTYRDDVLTRDMQWLREVNPRGRTLESWMREVNYTGDKPAGALLKLVEDHNRVMPNNDHIAKTLGKASVEV